jgi:hypothetical protein
MAFRNVGLNSPPVAEQTTRLPPWIENLAARHDSGLIGELFRWACRSLYRRRRSQPAEFWQTANKLFELGGSLEGPSTLRRVEASALERVASIPVGIVG